MTTTEPVESHSDSPKVTYPVLINVLRTYFATATAETFFLKYATTGERGIEFRGLLAELEAAVRSPESAVDEVNAALNTTHENNTYLDSVRLRVELAEVYDKLTEITEVPVEDELLREVVSEGEEKDETTFAPGELFDYYGRRKWGLPSFFGSLSNYKVPLWVVFVTGFVLMGASVGLAYLGIPSWLLWLPRLMAFMGLGAAGISSIVMLSLRSEALHPGRVEERAAGVAAMNRSGGPKHRKKWANRLG